MEQLIYLEPLEGMKDETCTFCEKQGIDVVIQHNIPGGGRLYAHKTCLKEYFDDGK